MKEPQKSIFISHSSKNLGLTEELCSFLESAGQKCWYSEREWKENTLVDLSKQFAVDIVNLCTDIKENRKSNVLLNQVLRSGTSIGANIHEANYAASKADLINKFQIALKECYETDYWLGLFRDTHMITEDEK